MRPGDVLYGRYELSDELRVDHFPGAREAGLEAYRAVDKATLQPVVIKVFPIPSEPELKSFALALWDREVRTSHLATSGPKGNRLLRLLDARQDREKSMLVLVSEAGGQSLAELLAMDPRPGLLRPQNRADLWQAFLEVATALEALHSAGLIHRNVSPESIYLEETEETALFRLGDFSWSVYLHGLSRMIAEPSAQATMAGTAAWSKYVAPENLGEASTAGESFRSDLFSLGLVIAECLIGQVEQPPGDRLGWLGVFRDKIRASEGLDPDEKILLLSLLEPSPTGRPASAAEVVDAIRSILSGLSRELPLHADGPMTAAVDTRPESRFWKDLSRWMDIDGLGNRLDAFVQSEFTGAKAYPLPDGGGRLWILGRSGTPYRAIPYLNKRDNKENLGVAGLSLLYRPPEVPAEPLLILDKGVTLTTRGWEPPRGPSWAPYFLQARNAERRGEAVGTQDLLVKRLRLTLEAERELTARQVFAYRLVEPPRTERDRQTIEVELDRDAIDPEFGKLERPTIEAWFRAQFAEERLDVELSDIPSLATSMNPDRRWRIREFKEGNRLVLERLPGGESPPQSGWLKPWDLAYLIPLFRRKQRAVDLARHDDYLLRSLMEPESVTIFPTATGSEDLASEILGTRPLYLVQGPPGTGKTYWAARVILRMLEEDETSRILVSAKDHKPLDHLMEEVRSAVRELGLDPPPILLRLSRKVELKAEQIDTIEEDLDAATRKILERAAKWVPTVPAWEPLGREWRELVAEQLEGPSPVWEQIVQGGANVVFLTSTSASLRDLEKSPPFDLVIIEESGKAYATELLPPMRLGRRWLLIGDHQQLPPFQHYEMLAAARRRLDGDEEYQSMDEDSRIQFAQLLDEELRFFGSLFSRVQNAAYPYKPRGARQPALRLNEEWRMPPLLSELISTVYYGERFVVRTPDRPLPFRNPEFMASSPLIWLATPYCAGRNREGEERPAPEGGYTNRYEARVVDRLLGSLAPPPRGGGSIVVLSPYLAQVIALKHALGRYSNLPNFNPEFDVHTVDSFQGRQADVVVVSMVRNNDAEQSLQALGFLTADERMNVLLSRASHQLVVVGCLELLESFAGAPDALRLGQLAQFVRKKGMVVDAGMLLRRDRS